VDTAAELEDIVVVGFVVVDLPQENRHTAIVPVLVAEVLVAEVLEQEEKSLLTLEGAVLRNSRCKLLELLLMTAVPG
jgi:hypothetical protein